jgi:hypothetical protein
MYGKTPPNFTKSELETIGLWLFAEKRQREFDAKTIEMGDDFASANRTLGKAYDLQNAASVIGQLIEGLEDQITASSTKGSFERS